jgi:oligopeptidase B
LTRNPQFIETDYVSERLQAPSLSDPHTHVPLSIFHKKGLLYNSQNPVLMKVYGAYGLTLSPEFTNTLIPYLLNGWIIVLAHIRGGGEFGTTWHYQGKQFQKKSSFSDFISATLHIIQRQYSSPSLMTATASSAGGLTLAAVANQRPDLFRAMVMKVPFLDITTSMMDESLPLTIHEYDEWGNPSTDSNLYSYMTSYDPYFNLASLFSQTSNLNINFPSMLLTTSIIDNRVPYWHSLKYVARLRHAARSLSSSPFMTTTSSGQSNERIVCLKTYKNSNHSSHLLEEYALEFAFLHQQLGISPTF